MVAIIQYTSAHKQSTHQHVEQEYLERYITIRIYKHNSNNTQHITKEYVIYTIKQKHTKHTTIYTMIQNRTKRI